MKNQCDNFEKKLTELSGCISDVRDLVVGGNNNDIIQKIKNISKFKTEAENNFNRINSRINTWCYWKKC